MNIDLSDGLIAALATLAVGLVGYGNLQTSAKRHGEDIAMLTTNIAVITQALTQDKELIADRLARLETRQEIISEDVKAIKEKVLEDQQDD